MVVQKTINGVEKWCVVHSNPKQRGEIIKCFDSKEEANNMHEAIVISKINAGKMIEKPMQHLKFRG